MTDLYNTITDILSLIEKGEFSSSRVLIQALLDQRDSIDVAQRRTLEFELERMNRIEKDFTATREEVVQYIQTYYPDLKDSDIERWEKARALEFKIIDGQKRYFENAARNLFRLDSQMKALWDATHPDTKITSGSGATLDLDIHIAQVIKQATESGRIAVEPKRLRIVHTVMVNADAVPSGEKLRCWIPFPRHIPDRQETIDFIRSKPEVGRIAPENATQRTIYLEKQAMAGRETVFRVEYELTSYGVYHKVLSDMVTEIEDKTSVDEFLREEPPHIMFTPELRQLSGEVIGDETNPYRKAQLLFKWINHHLFWASAREYSTIRNISDYAYLHRHGDCGIQTLLFITLCRLNGIPARWQSGWELQPPDDSMHDWGMIYFEPYGWVPMDITYGLRKSEDQTLKWFYLSGLDSYRIIFNDDIGQHFIPEKQYIRSDILDNQRGEVEWRKGNLYFDQWRWEFNWEILS